MKAAVFLHPHLLGGNSVSVGISELKPDGREYDQKIAYRAPCNFIERYFTTGYIVGVNI